MYRYLREVLVIELSKFLAYRSDFWMRTVMHSTMRIVCAYFLWSSLFADAHASAGAPVTFGGYTFEGMMVYYVLATLALNVVLIPGGFISEEIYQGTLTRSLVYPIAVIPFKYAAVFAQWLVCMVQLLLALGALLLFFPAGQLHPSAGSLAIAGALLLVANISFFVMLLNLELIAFWAEQVHGLWVMLLLTMNLLSGTMLPLSVFPEQLVQVLRWTPFPYLVSFPVRVLVGGVSGAELAWACGVISAWLLILGASASMLWRRGLRQYTGVGM